MFKLLSQEYLNIYICIFRMTTPLHPGHIQAGYTVHAVRLKYKYVLQYKIKIDNSLGNTLKIYFKQYLKHLIGKHTSF